MLRRQVLLPAEVPDVWRAITEPDTVEQWFGGRIEWDLRPGGAVRLDDPATPKAGVIDEVVPGKTLRFRWDVAGGGDASEIAYELTPEEEGTTLTVTERRLAAPESPPARQATPSACFTRLDADTEADELAWTAGDDALFRVWAAVPVGRGALLLA